MKTNRDALGSLQELRATVEAGGVYTDETTATFERLTLLLEGATRADGRLVGRRCSIGHGLQRKVIESRQQPTEVSSSQARQWSPTDSRVCSTTQLEAVAELVRVSGSKH